jgi:flagellar motility protein MotE (MotC chaperone)
MYKFLLFIFILAIPAFTIAEGPKDADATAEDSATQLPADTNANTPKATQKPKTAIPNKAKLAKRKTIPKRNVRDSFRPPALKIDSLNDELRRAAEENKTQGDRLATERVKIEQERANLEGDRTELEELLTKIEASRQELKSETKHLEATLKKNETLLKELTRARKVNAEQLRAIAENNCNGTPGDNNTASAAGNTDSAGGSRIKSLSKAIRNMKPKQAAQLLKSLDRDIAVVLLRRMPARQAGAVLSAMKPSVAAMLATDLATDPDTGEVLP